jgi:hypothetical protein
LEGTAQCQKVEKWNKISSVSCVSEGELREKNGLKKLKKQKQCG